MKAATDRASRTADARMLAIDADGRTWHGTRAQLPDLLRPGDVLVANDAATIPASLSGVLTRTGEPLEIRLAGRRTLAADDVRAFTALAFGAGDHRTRTEDRLTPPALQPGDVLQLGPLRGTVRATLGHPRLLLLRFEGTPDEVWAGIATHGRPVQYAHIYAPLALWDVWTSVAARPVAFEPPSAGFALDWTLLDQLRARGASFATLTHAAGLSSTGDTELDARFPLAEAYEIPDVTVRAIERARTRGGRVIAVGTTVTRALEHAASRSRGLVPGPGLATQRIGAHTSLRVVDALLTGVHEPGDSHFELLHAFADSAVLTRMNCELRGRGYRTHEFGDSVLLERQTTTARQRAATALGRGDFERIAETLADPRRIVRLRPGLVEAWTTELVRRVAPR